MSVPAQLGKYRIDGILGRGAMGVVYRGFDAAIGRTVALKTIRKELLTEEEREHIVIRFKNEAKAAGRLVHPNIVAVFDYGEDEESAFIVMEYVAGRALNKVLSAPEPIPLATAVAWMEQLLNAMDHAHFHGVIHRDIKPSNVIVNSNDQLKLTDFGVARIDSSNLTQLGSVIGTPSYMSPEQFLGEQVDARSDVFSAGVLFYQLLTRQLPFGGKVSANVMQKIMAETPVAPSELNPQLGTGFDEVVHKALAKKAEERFASARAFMHAVHRAYGDWRLTDGAPSRLRPSANRGDGAAPLPIQAVAEHSAGSSVSGTTASHSFDPETLSFFQSNLASFVGPLAKLLLQRASAKAGNVDELCSLVVEHIPSAQARSQFIEAVHAFQSRSGRTLPPRSPLRPPLVQEASVSQPASSTGIAQLLDADILGNAEQLLSPFVGPIAKVLVKRSAAHCRTPRDLYLALADAIPDAKQKREFLKQSGVE